MPVHLPALLEWDDDRHSPQTCSEGARLAPGGDSVKCTTPTPHPCKRAPLERRFTTPQGPCATALLTCCSARPAPAGLCHPMHSFLPDHPSTPLIPACQRLFCGLARHPFLPAIGGHTIGGHTIVCNHTGKIDYTWKAQRGCCERQDVHSSPPGRHWDEHQACKDRSLCEMHYRELCSLHAPAGAWGPSVLGKSTHSVSTQQAQE